VWFRKNCRRSALEIISTLRNAWFRNRRVKGKFSPKIQLNPDRQWAGFSGSGYQLDLWPCLLIQNSSCSSKSISPFLLTSHPCLHAGEHTNPLDLYWVKSRTQLLESWRTVQNSSIQDWSLGEQINSILGVLSAAPNDYKPVWTSSRVFCIESEFRSEAFNPSNWTSSSAASSFYSRIFANWVRRTQVFSTPPASDHKCMY